MLDYLKSLDQILTLRLNGSHSLFWDGFAQLATMTVTWLPLAAVLFYVIVKNNDMRNILWALFCIGLCVLVSDQVSSSIVKPMVQRFRPTNDPDIMYLVDVVNDYRGGKYGFFSSHAANTFSIACFVAWLMRCRALTVVLFLHATVICWTRVYLGVHYLGDLLVGTLFGLLVGTCVYAFCWKVSKRSQPATYASDQVFTAGGYAIADVQLLFQTLAMTYMLVAALSFFFP